MNFTKFTAHIKLIRNNESFTYFTKVQTPLKGGNALVTPLVLQVSMGGGDRLPSGDPSARLPSYRIKKNQIMLIHVYLLHTSVGPAYIMGEGKIAKTVDCGVQDTFVQHCFVLIDPHF